MCLFKLVFLFSLDKYPETELWITQYFYFWFVEKLHYSFKRVPTNLHSHQQRTKVPFAPHPSQHLFLVFFDTSCSDGYKVISQGGFDLHFPDDQ